MNRYPLWKYLIMIVAIVIGLFYTLPNIFPQVPAVQIVHQQAVGAPRCGAA